MFSLPKHCYRILLFGLFLLTVWPSASYAQDLLKGKDLSTVKVDQLSESDLSKLLQQIKQASLSISQAEQMAAAKGMPQGEIMKLRERLSALEKKGNTATETTGSTSKEQSESEYVSVAKPVSAVTSPMVFGAQLFTSTSLAFEPNLRIATPANYQLGPDDELQLTIFGVQEASYRLPISAEGTLSIPNVGVITVAGLTMEDANRTIRQKLVSTVYRSMAAGVTNMTLTLGKIRSIRVTVVGAASKPGNYTVSSLTTLFNALFVCGGPNDIGSYREIELIRNNKIFLKADLYDFLIKGDTRQNVLLKEGDVINIPVYQKRAVIQGEVKRPGYFELLSQETANELIRYAGGFTDRAYTANIRISQLTDREKRIRNLSKEGFLQYQPSPGDSIYIEPILERYENRVVVTGAVFRPGAFELEPGLTVSKLISRADGLKEDAFTGRALLIRQKADLSRETMAFSLSDLLNNAAADIVLQKNDSIRIASINDLKDERIITINGEVRKAGVFLYKDNYSLKDLLFEAGGFTDAASAYRIEVSRRINAGVNELKSTEGKLAEVITINADKDLGLQGAQVPLQPFDLVTVRRDPGYFEQQQITVSGEVFYPGSYTIQNKAERISDVLQRAGGFTSAAYPEAVSLIRLNKGPKIQKEEKAKIFAGELKDSVKMDVTELMDPTVKIALNMRKILADPGNSENLLLEPGDILEVPKKDGLVKISGEVYSPTKVTFEEGEKLNYYLSRAGGITDEARKNRAYVIYANGQIAKTEKYLFGLVKKYPRIQPGADIVVPAKAVKTKASTAEVVGIAGVLVSMAGVTISILNALR